MLKNYLKVALRSLMKNKTFSFINIVGLSIGTLCCLYIVLYVMDQYSYDKHHKNVNDIYRVNSLISSAGEVTNSATTSPPIAPAIKNDFPEVKQFARVIGTIGVQQHLLQYREKSFYETDACFVDSTFFDVFTYHFDHGSPVNALSDPYSVVLLKPTADKLFGNEDPVGKLISINNSYGKHDFKVTGVVDESLGKSHIHANMFIAMNSGGIGEYVRTNTSWAGNNFASSYLKLQDGANVATLEKKLPAFLNKYGGDQLKQLGMHKELHLQPVASIHTTTGYKHDDENKVSPAFLRILLLIAALIQVIACINFMNLSTARGSKRAREVGVRKVIGARKGDLIRQFMGESVLISLAGVAVALPLLWVALPYLNRITEADIRLSSLFDYRIWLMMLELVVVTGVVAGSYPAFYLSAFQAIKVIKGNFTNRISAVGIRRSLVVFQFVLSIVLITGIIIIYSQLNYVKNRDLGFDQSQKLIFSFYTADAGDRLPAFVDDLRQLREVKAVSRSNNYLTHFIFNDVSVYPPGGNASTAKDARFIVTDENFLKANGIQLISGRNFRLYDTAGVLINQTLAKQLGITPEKAPGTRLFQSMGDPSFFYKVLGVVKDFNFNSLREDIKPFMFVYSDDRSGLKHVTVSTNTANYGTLLSKIEKIWHNDLPGVPFEYMFLDDQVQQQYKTELTLARIINSFTLMAILVSCLGLFGLAAFSAEQRNKEIGIRKVLGANVAGIVQLLSKDFLRLVAIAIVIAAPISWWAMNKWLEAYAYRVPISWWMFAVAGLLAILIAMFTVSFQAVKAALVNPVKSLRSE